MKSADRTIVFRNVMIAIVVIAAVAGLLATWNSRRTADEATSQPVVDGRRAGDAVADDATVTGSGEATLPPSGDDPLVAEWTRKIGSAPQWPARLQEPSCEEADSALRRVCDALDREAGREPGTAWQLVRESADALASNPPTASGELKTHAAVLASTAHAFRVLGRPRIRALREIGGDGSLHEPFALALYRWLISRGACADGTGAAITRDSLYAYANFAFTTIGGQAYLRRRSARDEALACVWAIQLLERSISEGHNPGGIDLRSEIGRCRGLAATQPLVFSGRYVRLLEDAEQIWKRRTGGG